MTAFAKMIFLASLLFALIVNRSMTDNGDNTEDDLDDESALDPDEATNGPEADSVADAKIDTDNDTDTDPQKPKSVGGDESDKGGHTTPNADDDDDDDEEEVEEEPIGRLCYQAFLDCWNDTKLSRYTKAMFGEKRFDLYMVVDQTLPTFCDQTAPRVAACMAESLAAADEIDSKKANTESMLANCTYSIDEEESLYKNEKEEFGDFYRSFHYLCGGDQKQNHYCFVLKQRFCVIERHEDECNKPCIIPQQGYGHDIDNRSAAGASGKGLIWALIGVKFLQILIFT